MPDVRAPLSDWILEQFVLDELPLDQKERIEQQMTRDPDLANRVERLRASNEEILRAHPPNVFAAQVHRRAAHGNVKRPSWHVRWSLLSPALAAAAVVILLLVRPGVIPSTNPGDANTTTEIRSKGLKPSLRVYRRQGGRAEQLMAGTEVSAGDVLQVSYIAAGAKHGVIVSIDGWGGVTLHHPLSPVQSSDLIPDKESPLEAAYRLDDAPAFERFFFVTANAPLEPKDVIRAAKRLARDLAEAQTANLDLPESCGQSTFLLRKGESSR